MNSIMIDNWSILQLIKAWKTRSKTPQLYHDLITAFVLWEEVIYPNNEYVSWKNFDSPFKNELTIVEINDRKYRSEVIDIMNRTYSKQDDKAYLNKQTDFQWINKNILGEEYSIVELSALNYILICQEMACDYLPCPERRLFINSLHDPELIRIIYNKLTYWDLFENEYKEYVIDIYRHLKDEMIKINYPLLTNYVIENIEDGMTIIQSAKHLREEGLFVKYRQYLDRIDEAIQGHEWMLLSNLVKDIDDVSNEIFHKDSNGITTIEATLFPNPSIVINKDLRFKIKKSGLSLLYNIGNFAKSGMSKRYSDEEYWSYLG